MDAVDAYIPTPERPIDKPFLMPIEDVFTISGAWDGSNGKGRERDRQGRRRSGDSGTCETRKTVATGVEMFRKLLDEGRAGDNVGVLLRGTAKEDVERGRYWRSPGASRRIRSSRQRHIYRRRKRGEAHAVFQRISSAVLLQDDGCNRSSEAAGGDRDGDAR